MTKHNQAFLIPGLEETEQRTVGHFIGLFQAINPGYKRLFPNKTQRKSIENLLKIFGPQKLEKVILALPDLINRKYAPVITTPYQLETKLGMLLIFMKKEHYGNGFSQDLYAEEA